MHARSIVVALVGGLLAAQAAAQDSLNLEQYHRQYRELLDRGEQLRQQQQQQANERARREIEARENKEKLEQEQQEQRKAEARGHADEQAQQDRPEQRRLARQQEKLDKRREVTSRQKPEIRRQLIEGLSGVGYRFVALDLAGLRSGSLNPSIADGAPRMPGPSRVFTTD